MPIYEYQCDACRHKFEAIQRITDDLLTQCPECNEKKLRKLVSAAGFRLKGTGWYVTDFRDNKSGKKKENGSGDGDSKPAGDSGGGDKESKTAQKEASGAAAGTGTNGKKAAVD